MTGRADVPLGVYVHVPFCLRKCIYCDFNSRPLDKGLAERYVKALVREARSRAPQCMERAARASTLYLGGGTPTCLELEHLARIIDACGESFALPADAEVTVECNPGTVDEEGLRLLRQVGANRLSIGAQAFQDGLLRRMNRIHGVADTFRAVEAARAAGFENLSLDLMFGLPGQTTADWEETLEKTVGLGPEHVSAYALQLEPGTPLARMVEDGSVRLPGEDDEVAMWDAAVDVLNAAGYERYEISNYARPGFRSAHNLIYWTGGDYIGLGAGACGRLGNTRTYNAASPEEYCAKVEAGMDPAESIEHLDGRTMMVETVIMGLRLAEGISMEEFERRFGVSMHEAFPGAVERLERRGLLMREGVRVKLTGKGFYLANVAFREFVD